MNYGKAAHLAIVLLLLAAVPFSLSAFAQSDQLKDQASEPAEPNDDLKNDSETTRAFFNEETVEEEDWENRWEDEPLEHDEWDEEEEDDIEEEECEEEEWDDEECEDEEHEPFEHARELAILADNKPAAFAYTTQLLIESAGEEQALAVLKNILASTQDPTARRLVAIRIAELYAELDQPSKIQSLLIEICQ